MIIKFNPVTTQNIRNKFDNLKNLKKPLLEIPSYQTKFSFKSCADFLAPF